MTVILDRTKHCRLLAKNLVDMIERFESREIIAPVAFRSFMEYKDFCSDKFTIEQKISMRKIMDRYKDELGQPLIDKLKAAEPLLKINENELIYNAYMNNSSEIKKFMFETLDTKDKFYFLFKNIGK